MEILQLSAFVSLAKTLYMPLTAQELNTSQSHISKLIGSLEAELGVKLFDRIGRRIILNEHGRLFFEYASNAMQLMHDGQNALKHANKSALGAVKIGSYAFMPILHPCIAAFAKENPNAAFYFPEVRQQDQNALMSMTDMILSAARGKTYTMQRYFPVNRELLEESFYVVVSPKLIRYPKEKISIQLDEISRFPMIEVAPSFFYDNWVFQPDDVRKIQDQTGVTLRIGYMANDFYTKVSLLKQGLGFALFPEVCIAAVLEIAPDLQVFTIEKFSIRRKIIIARKHRDQMSSASRIFWDYLLDYYQLPPDKA